MATEAVVVAAVEAEDEGGTVPEVRLIPSVVPAVDPAVDPTDDPRVDPFTPAGVTEGSGGIEFA